MVTEGDWEKWTYEDLLPYMETVLEVFEPERIMMGSDWPVCKLAGEYQEVMQIIPEFVASLDQRTQDRILFKNAIDCYQLNYHTDGKEKD